MYWLSRLVDDLAVTDENGEVRHYYHFACPEDLLQALREWAAGGPDPSQWEGDELALLVAEGWPDMVIEETRALIHRVLAQGWYDPIGGTAKECLEHVLRLRPWSSKYMMSSLQQEDTP